MHTHMALQQQRRREEKGVVQVCGHQSHRSRWQYPSASLWREGGSWQLLLRLRWQQTQQQTAQAHNHQQPLPPLLALLLPLVVVDVVVVVAVSCVGCCWFLCCQR